MISSLRRSCGTQLVTDTVVISVLLAAQIVILYLLWMKDRFFVPPEILIPAYIETVLVTLFLQVVAIVQLLLLAWGFYSLLTQQIRRKFESENRTETGMRLDVKDLAVGVLYVFVCLGGAFLAAAASRPWHSEPLEGGTDIFLKMLRLTFVLFLVFPGIYAVYHGAHSPLLRSPSYTPPRLPPFPSASRLPAAETPELAGQDLKLIAAGVLLLPLYALLACYSFGPFDLLSGPDHHTVLDIEQLQTIITFVMAALTGCGILCLFVAIGIQTGRRMRMRTNRVSQEINLVVLSNGGR